MSVLKRTIRGIRDSIPAGYIMGRLSAGNGPAELIDLASLSRATAAATGGGTGTTSGKTADFGLFFSGKPAANQVVFEMVMSKAVKLPQNLSGSQCNAVTAPTSTFVFTLLQNGVSIGTISLAAGTGVPTFTFAAAVTLAIADKFKITGQATPDGTMADIAFSFAATFV